MLDVRAKQIWVYEHFSDDSNGLHLLQNNVPNDFQRLPIISYGFQCVQRLPMISNVFQWLPMVSNGLRLVFPTLRNGSPMVSNIVSDALQWNSNALFCLVMDTL